MMINKKVGTAAILILLVMTTVSILYKTDNQTEKNIDTDALNIAVKQPTTLRVIKVQGDELTKMDSWLAEQNRTGLQSNSIP